MDPVRSAPSHCVKHASGRVAKLGSKTVDLDFELLHRFDWRGKLDTRGPQTSFRCVDSVHKVKSGLNASSADRNCAATRERTPNQIQQVKHIATDQPHLENVADLDAS